MNNIVLVTGGFDPIHSGHIAYINDAAKLGRVVVGLNSDKWLSRKKGNPFMPLSERLQILSNIKNVLCVIEFDDSDGTAIDAIMQVKRLFPKEHIIFANGGDRTEENIPELDAFIGDTDVSFEFSVGGSLKKNSSSWILKDWKSPETTRNWGCFLKYYESPEMVVKRLVIEPGKSISMQYHNDRSEMWFVESGTGCIYTIRDDQEIQIKELNKHDHYHINVGSWHRVQNNSTTPLCLVEIQYGSRCSEEDIIRK